MRQAQDETRASGGSYELWERNRLVGKNGNPRGEGA
jgi:hypothetical protein